MSRTLFCAIDDADVAGRALKFTAFSSQLTSGAVNTPTGTFVLSGPANRPKTRSFADPIDPIDVIAKRKNASRVNPAVLDLTWSSVALPKLDVEYPPSRA